MTTLNNCIKCGAAANPSGFATDRRDGFFYKCSRCPFRGSVGTTAENAATIWNNLNIIEEPAPHSTKSARERMAEAAAEMNHLRNAAAAEFRAEIDRIGKRMGFDIVAEPRMIRTRGVFTLGAELVIVERDQAGDSDGDEG